MQNAQILKLFIEEYNSSIFPLRKNQKTPIHKGGYQVATSDHAQIEKWIELTGICNWGLATGKISQNIVLDVDVKEGKNGLDSLSNLETEYGKLPKTLVIETPSGGIHYYFKYPENCELVKNSVEKLGSGLDIRGDGGHVVIPPSEIDGKPYRIIEKNEIAPAPEWLLSKLLGDEEKDSTKTTGFSKLEDEIPQKGNRNDSLFRYASALRSKGIDFHGANELMLEKALSCNPPLGAEEAIEILRGVYERYDDGTDLDKQVERINRKYFFVHQGGKSRIGKVDETDNSIKTMSVQAFKDYFLNKNIIVGDKKINLGIAWLNHKNRRTYEGMVFLPGMDAPQGYLNTWRGFPFEAVKGDCSLYLDHIKKIICSGNEEIYSYLIAWMANIVQNPNKRAKIAICLKGKQGTGKGVFVNEFGMLFCEHYRQITQGKQLTGNFNAHLENTILLFADEAFWAGDKQSAGVLKGLITEDNIAIEKKGVDVYQAKNYVNLIMASNEKFLTPAGLDDRRNMVLEVSDARRQDHQYFNAIVNQMENGGREALLFYLQNYDISNVNLYNCPKTNALLTQKEEEMTEIQKFWYQCLLEGEFPNIKEWPEKITVDGLYEVFLEFKKRNGTGYTDPQHIFGRELKSIAPPTFEKKRLTVNGKRINAYVIPPLEECREYFSREVVCQEVDWDN